VPVGQKRVTRAVVLTGTPTGLADAVAMTSPTRVAARTPLATQSAVEPVENPARRVISGGGKWHPLGFLRTRLLDRELAPPDPPTDNAEDAVPSPPEPIDVPQPPAPLTLNRPIEHEPAAQGAQPAITDERALHGDPLVIFEATNEHAHPLASQIGKNGGRVVERPPADDAQVNHEPADGIPATEDVASAAPPADARDADSFLFAGLDVAALPARSDPAHWAEDYYGFPMDDENRREAIQERVVGLAITPDEAQRIYRDDPEVRKALWGCAVVAGDDVRRALVAIALRDADEVRVTDAIDVALNYTGIRRMKR
jgi:hypothetical protein